MQLKILCDTTLKLEPKQASMLTDDQRQAIAAGTVEIASYSPASDHIKITLKNSSYKGKNTWYIFQKHAAILDGNDLIFPQTVKLAVPYYDQLDNSENPYGTCNVTSTAMCLAYLGAKRQHPDGRFPDELYDYCEDHGLDRHDPEALAQVIRAYGCKDNFATDSNFQQLKEWLVQGNPAIVHGYFTASGHIVTIIGFNPSGFIINDPYGELMFNSADGGYYDTHASGAGLTYSYPMMQQVCCTDDQLWLHRVSR